MGDPDTAWLNYTNAVLGLLVLSCIVAVLVAVARELLLHRRHSRFRFELHIGPKR